MKITTQSICGQIYIIPTIKITYDKFLNGDYEVIFVWYKTALVISF